MKKTIVPEVFPSKTPKIYKNKKLNNANFGDFTHTDYQVFLHLVSKIGGVDEFGKYLQPEQLQREHALSAKEFSTMFNVSLSHCYGILKKAVDKLMKTDIRVEKPELEEIWRINVCSMAQYNEKVGTITIEFTDRIMPYLAQVKERFVLYNLKEISNFGSLYTTRLYELIQEFKETGWLRKSVQQLREVFAVGKAFKRYGDFKKYTFAHACDEINRNYDIGLSFKEIKEGRKVAAVEFSFKPVVVTKVVNQKTGLETNLYVKQKSAEISSTSTRSSGKRKPGMTHISDILEGQLSFDNIKPSGSKNPSVAKVKRGKKKDIDKSDILDLKEVSATSAVEKKSEILPQVELGSESYSRIEVQSVEKNTETRKGFFSWVVSKIRGFYSK